MATWEGRLVRGPQELGAEGRSPTQKAGSLCPHPAGLPALGTGKWPAPPSPAGAASCPPSPQASEGAWDLFQDVPHPFTLGPTLHYEVVGDPSIPT